MDKPELDHVRSAVRGVLEESAAYRNLAPDAQAQLAHDMVNVSRFLANPAWLDPGSSPARAKALASDPVDDLKKRLAKDPGQVAFDAKGMKQGIEGFGQLVQKVDFPAFVSGLVKGVFNAVVDASIQQMRAYAEMLAAVSKSVDQFASDHIPDAQVRDQIAQRYPSIVQIDTSGDTAKLALREGAEDKGIDVGKEFGLSGVDLSDENAELQLVNAAKLEMARQRQQLMATMVLLGINRIVITNGKINAKVVFDIQASDQAKRGAKAEMHDEQSSSSTEAAAAAAWSPWGAAGGGFSASQAHSTTVGSAVDDTSESKASLKAQLSGDVQLNFKSETFPLEKMVDSGGMSLLNQRAQPTSTPAQKGAAK
ncbi:MAG TPA: hypothetical protein VFE90_09135 [Myxococcales bacterium]|nr:hypothetical protein [Myxococcales bacterium]